MSLKKLNPRTVTLLAFIVTAALLRIVFGMDAAMKPLADFSPIGAMALFGGAYFRNNGKAYLFPLITIWLGDVVLNRFVFYHEWRFFYSGFYWVYGAFALMVLAGQLIVRKATVKNIALASVVAMLIHWIVTDFGVWLEGTMYAKTWAGWWECLVAAIPYEGNFLAGMAIYSLVLFGGFEWARKHNTASQTA